MGSLLQSLPYPSRSVYGTAWFLTHLRQIMKQLLFYAAERDLLPVFETVERSRPLKYVRMGQVEGLDLETFAAGVELPNLGKASSDSAINSDSFLVAEYSLPIKTRRVKGAVGERLYVDQLENPDTLVLTPGGAWETGIILHGRAATVSESMTSQELMKQFHAAFRKHFTKIKAYFVGPEALTLLEAGRRLTISAQSPRDFDLRIGP